MYQPAHRKFEVEDPAAVLAELCRYVPATLVTRGPKGFRASILPMLFDAEPTVAEPRGAEPRVAEPTVAEPTVAEPTVAEPTVAEPTVAEPAVAEPTVSEPTGAEPAGLLRGHLARGNPQWREVEAAIVAGIDGGGDAIAIFDGPDAYVSPAWYEEKRLTGRVVPTWNYVTVQAHGRLTTRHEPDWLIAHVARLVERHEAGRADPWALSDAPEDYVRAQARAIVGLELRIARIEAKAKLSQNRSAADIDGTIDGLARGSALEQAIAAEMRRRR